MARLACPQPPGIPLHLVLRGAREDLPAAAAETECAVHAYARMATHLHLLLTSSRPGGATLLAERLLAREFDASPVLARRYLLACMRYIELNPVRAGLVRHPAEFRASSYRANALGEPDALVTPHAVYCALGRDAASRSAAYRAGFRAAARSPGRRPAC
jgi:putative transposase